MTFDRFGVGLGADLTSQMEPGGGGRAVLVGPWGVEDGLGIDLFRLSCRVVVLDIFFGPLELVLVSFWVLLGSFFGHLGWHFGAL